MPQAPNNDLYKFPSEKSKGIIGTIVFHVVLAVILIITGFHTPQPPPEEEGILVNFGYDETGSGLVEPSTTSGGTPEISEASSEESVPVETASSPQVEQGEPVLTQEFEESAVVEKAVEQPDPEEVRKREEAIRAEKIRQQKAEEERLRQEAEAAEKLRKQQEQERLAREAKEREQKRDNIFSRTINAFNKSNAAGNNTGNSEGEAGGEGNQGVETGTVNANKYGPGGGPGTKGISFDLAGRKIRALPKPKYDIQNEGIVVVEITVDREGNVISASPGVKGSTTLEEYFLRVAREAAMGAKFNRKPDAPSIQKGTITYHFILR